MATKNDITGDSLISKANTKAYENNYDLIFGKKSALCDICGKDLASTKECAWTSCPLNWDEKRADIIGHNGNIGYEPE
jgi:hypothetical protein